MEPPTAQPAAAPATDDALSGRAEDVDLENAERSIYRPTTSARDLPTIIRDDVAARAGVLERQQRLLEARYDLSDRPRPGVMMSGGRKAVQAGVRTAEHGAFVERLARSPSSEA